MGLVFFCSSVGRAEEFDFPLSVDHPFISWWMLQGTGDKEPNVKYQAIKSGKRFVFSPLGKKQVEQLAGFDFRLAGEGDFSFSLDVQFDVPKLENGGLLAISIPFHSTPKQQLVVRVYPTNATRPEIRISATESNRSDATILGKEATIRIDRKKNKMTISLIPKSGESVVIEPFEVPTTAVRPSIVYAQCVPEKSPVHYDLKRFTARLDRSPASLPPMGTNIGWLTWALIGFGLIAVVACAIHFLVHRIE